MSTTPEGYAQNTDPVTGWTGWVMFAAVLLMIIGTLNAIQGLGAIFRDEAYWLTISGDVLIFDTTTWGWIHLLIGLAMLAVGAMLMRGSTFARVIAIALVAVNLIAQFTSANLYPFWALIMIGVDIVIIYALVIHGGELKSGPRTRTP